VISSLLNHPQKKQKVTYDASMRLKIAEYAVEHGNAKASREFNAPKSTVSFMVKEPLAARQKSKMCLRLSVVKPLHAEWVITTMSALKKKKEVGQQGFRLAGILDCFEANLADMQPLHQRVEHTVLIATQEELKAAEQMGDENDYYDSSDDDLTVAELINKNKVNI
jgi:hypothetical protein